MKFREIRDSLITLLGNAAAGRYRVTGYQEHVKAADEVVDNERSVTVYYASGNFPKEKGSLRGPNMHNMTFNLELTVASPAKADLTASSPAELATSLANLERAAYLADRSLDELFDIIYQVVMDAQNIDLGMSDTDPVADRWIGDFDKNEPIDRGDFFLLTGSAVLTCAISEDVTGETPTEANEFSTTLETKAQEDSAEQDSAPAGVLVTN